MCQTAQETLLSLLAEKKNQDDISVSELMHAVWTRTAILDDILWIMPFPYIRPKVEPEVESGLLEAVLVQYENNGKSKIAQ